MKKPFFLLVPSLSSPTLARYDLPISRNVAFIFDLQIAREPYSQWAEGHIQRIKKVLDGARAEHTQAVQQRIDSVGQMKDVVSLTKSLFELSKVWHVWYSLAFSRSEIDQVTAKLESETFVQKQKVELASELKGVLDSWVRFEQQQKESEQADLTKAVVNKVLENLKESKTQQEILASATPKWNVSPIRWMYLYSSSTIHWRLCIELVKSKAI